jgi:hypothetical protein
VWGNKIPDFVERKKEIFEDGCVCHPPPPHPLVGPALANYCKRNGFNHTAEQEAMSLHVANTLLFLNKIRLYKLLLINSIGSKMIRKQQKNILMNNIMLNVKLSYIVLARKIILN